MSAPRRSFFWLYRPTVPTARAQSIQVVNSAHALACRGHAVTLAVQAPGGTTPSEVLSFYGLTPVAGLHLHLLPLGNTAASLAHRAHFARWVWRTDGAGIAIARNKRYAREALRRLGGRFRLVLEAHKVDSLQAAERGEDAAATWALEAEVLAGADAVVANCPGTLALLGAHHTLPPAIALHNATHASRIRTPGVGTGCGYVGSALSTKDLDTLALAARRIQLPVHVVGPGPWGPLVARSGGRLIPEPAVPHHAVPDRLCHFRVLVLPLGRGLFGERLTSPLKLWDYLAAGVPIVGADLPALHDAAPGAFLPYTPGDPDHLAACLERVASDPALRARLLDAAQVRTWDTRAAALEVFLERVLPARPQRSTG